MWKRGRSPILHALAVLSVFAGCRSAQMTSGTTRALFPPDTPHEFSDDPRQCKTNEDCADGMPCQRGLCANLYFRDEVDQGDDAFNPGCHFSCSDPLCTQNRLFESGDRCADHITLLEWTDRTCHDDMDLFTTDCVEACRTEDPPFDHGVCISVINACGPGMPSAKCYCYNDPYPQP